MYEFRTGRDKVLLSLSTFELKFSYFSSFLRVRLVPIEILKKINKMLFHIVFYSFKGVVMAKTGISIKNNRIITENIDRSTKKFSDFDHRKTNHRKTYFMFSLISLSFLAKNR